MNSRRGRNADPPEVVTPEIDLPELGPDDVYLYAHANGAISVTDTGGGSEVVTLDVAIAVAAGCLDDGSRVVGARDDTPIAVDAIERIRSAGVELTPYDAAAAPMRWSGGTDALMHAAAQKDDQGLVDLLTRGADFTRRDDSDSTVLHHAAKVGNRVAIDILAAMGADLDAVNDMGLTAYALAEMFRQRNCVVLLTELGADTGIGPRETVRFRGGNLRYVDIYPLLVATILGITGALVWPWGILDVVLLLAIAAACLLIAPPRAAWAGGSAHSLTGTILTVRTLTRRTRQFDLRDVSFAATGGSISWQGHAGWLLLGHPGGHPAGRPRVFRRLDVPSADLDATARRITRVVVIPITGGRGDDVFRPIGDVLVACQVEMTPTMQDQLRRFHDWHRRWDGDPPRGIRLLRERIRSDRS